MYRIVQYGGYYTGQLSSLNIDGISCLHFDRDYSSATDRPFDYGDMIHIQTDVANSKYCIQIAVSYEGDIKTRRKWGNTWTEWKSIQLT